MRRPLTALSAAFALALSLAPAVQGSAASTCAAPNGSQFRVSSRDLAAPSAQATCQARLALQKHAVVTAIAARPGISQLGKVLGMSLPEPSATLSASSSVKSNTTAVFQGVHIDLRGVTNVYQGLAAAGGEAQAAVDFNRWVSQQAMAPGLAPPAIPSSARTPWAQPSMPLAAAAPSSTAWTPLFSAVSAYTDYQGTSVHFTMSNYRLNDINTGGDWYLFATQLQTAPAYGGCNYSSCGPWTIQRNVRIPGPAPLSLADYGPTGTITSSTTGYTVGAGLSAGTDVGVGVSASYSQTWDQPSVVTYDQTSYATATAAWQENFGGPSYYWWPAGPTAPPSTSTSSFQSDQAAIFKAPEGTSSFSLTSYGMSETQKDYNGHTCFLISFPFYTPYYCYNSTWTGVNLSVRMNVVPPVLSVSPAALSLSRGTSGTFSIQAVVPDSGQGMVWDVTNIPSWLTITSLSGSGAGSVTVTVARKTPIGSVAYLNFNTSPAFSAPSVEHGPIVVPVTALK